MIKRQKMAAGILRLLDQEKQQTSEQASSSSRVVDEQLDTIQSGNIMIRYLDDDCDDYTLILDEPDEPED